MSKQVQYGTDKNSFFVINPAKWEPIKEAFNKHGGATVDSVEELDPLNDNKTVFLKGKPSEEQVSLVRDNQVGGCVPGV